jgi:hypothetical protein
VFCQQCGREVPGGLTTCPACHYVNPPIRGSSPASDSLDQAIADAKSAAKDMAALTAELSHRLAAKAERASKDPTGSAKRAAQRMADELEKARVEIENALKDL